MRSRYDIRLRCLAAACAAVGCASIASATPYASSINDLGSGSYSFYLNEAADSAVVKFNTGAPLTLTSPTAGLQNFTLPAGATSFTIEVQKSAPAAWSVIGTDSYANNFELPRGVGVNTNPGLNGSFNPWFGTVYVANARNLPTAAGRNVTNGVYVLNPDMTQKFADDTSDFFDDARKGGINWPNTTGGVSPFRLQVGPDNKVYMTDWSDPNGGLWAHDPAITTNEMVLDTPSRDANGAGPTHGSISDVLIRGTGANRVIYTEDEDGFYAPGETAPAHAGSILRYDIGTTTTFVGPPSAIAFDNDAPKAFAGSTNINFFNSLDMAKDGTLWWSQNRSGNAGEVAASLIQVSPTTGEVLWNSLALAPTGTADTDPLRSTQGIAVDPVTGRMALVTARTVTEGDATYSGLIIIFDPATKTIVTQFGFDSAGASSNTDVVWDAAGNLYVGNRAAERVRVWSPGGDWIAKTGSDGTFSLSALNAALAGDVNNDGLVNGQDINPFVYALLNGQTAFAAQYPTGAFNNADVNADTLVNGQDINPFVAKLLGQGVTISPTQLAALQAVPEPGMLGLVLAAAPMVLRRRRSGSTR